MNRLFPKFKIPRDKRHLEITKNLHTGLKWHQHGLMQGQKELEMGQN